MGVKTFKAKTSTLRHTKLEDRSHLAKDSGPRKLLKSKKQKAGRNNQGKITVRHRGGGKKRKIRIVDFKRQEKLGIKAVVENLYFDPNRSAHLALLKYEDGDKRYIIAPKGLKPGDEVVAEEKSDIVVGNAMKIKNIPTGTIVNCVENVPDGGAKYGRSAGNSLVVQGVDVTGKYIQVKMPSTEIRLLHAECYATIGQIGNEERNNVKLGKAGRKRNLGWRPVVRGMAMHAAQHPHGGGENRGVVGNSKNIWGHRRGVKTRNNKRTDKFIIRRRKVKSQK